MSTGVGIVTGAGRGIGRAICRRFGRAGWHMAGLSRTANDLQETGDLVENEGGSFSAHPVDITDGLALADAVRAIQDDRGRIDLLVNCAGMVAVGAVDELSPADLERMLAVNVTGLYRACRVVWPVMKSGGGGVIVNISSLAAFDPFAGLGAYGGTKAWVNLWSKSLAAEGKPHGIRVFAIAPGAVETDMLRGAFPEFPADQAIDPMDVANVAFAMAQPECRYASGGAICVQM